MRPPLQLIVINVAGHDRAWVLLSANAVLAAGALEAGHTDEDLREVFREALDDNRIPALIEERERWLALAEQIPILRAQIAGPATRIAEALESMAGLLADLHKLAQAGREEAREEAATEAAYLRDTLIAHRQSALLRLASRQLTDMDVPHETIDYAVVRLMQGAPIEEIQKEVRALKERGALLAKALRPLGDQPGDADDGSETEISAIRFALGSWWTGHTQQLALRLQHLLVGAEVAGFVPLYKDGAWQIDSAGNWLLRIEGDQGELQYRYLMVRGRWTALRVVVAVLLGVQLVEGAAS